MTTYLARWLGDPEPYTASSPKDAAIQHAETLGCRRVVVSVVPAFGFVGLGFLACLEEETKWVVDRVGATYVARAAREGEDE